MTTTPSRWSFSPRRSLDESGFDANLITAADDGIHWRAIRQAARLIKYVSVHSPHGQGNFNFGAIAMMKPYGPFYPGSYSGGGRNFAVGLESANVVDRNFREGS